MFWPLNFERTKPRPLMVMRRVVPSGATEIFRSVPRMPIVTVGVVIVTFSLGMLPET